MKTVGIRELKNRLSEYLRQVRAGENLLVTDRGEVIAEFSPPGRRLSDPSVPPSLRAMVTRGIVTLGEPREESAHVYDALPRRRRGKISSSQLLDEERGSH